MKKQKALQLTPKSLSSKKIIIPQYKASPVKKNTERSITDIHVNIMNNNTYTNKNINQGISIPQQKQKNINFNKQKQINNATHHKQQKQNKQSYIKAIAFIQKQQITPKNKNDNSSNSSKNISKFNQQRNPLQIKINNDSHDFNIHIKNQDIDTPKFNAPKKHNDISNFFSFGDQNQKMLTQQKKNISPINPKKNVKKDFINDKENKLKKFLSSKIKI